MSRPAAVTPSDCPSLPRLRPFPPTTTPSQPLEVTYQKPNGNNNHKSKTKLQPEQVGFHFARSVSPCRRHLNNYVCHSAPHSLPCGPSLGRILQGTSTFQPLLCPLSQTICDTRPSRTSVPTALDYYMQLRSLRECRRRGTTCTCDYYDHEITTQLWLFGCSMYTGMLLRFSWLLHLRCQC